MALETRATPAMATLPIGDGRLNPYPLVDAGSIPATATTTFNTFIILSIFLVREDRKLIMFNHIFIGL